MTDSHLEKSNLAILVSSQIFFLIASITVMTLSGVVGQQLSPRADLATLPVAMMTLGAVLSTFPASLFMKRVGRRLGFMTGAAFGLTGGLLSLAAIASQSFVLFCAGNFLLGVYQGFAMYYRFAAADVTSPVRRGRAISYVMAGGVAAAFLGPWNVSAAANLIAPVPLSGPYAVVAVLALAAMALLYFLRVPASGEPQAGDSSRPLRTVAAQPAFIVAVLAAAVAYAVMILVMTATPLAMRAQGFSMKEAALVMQWHVLGMFAPSFFTGSLIARFGMTPILTAGAVLLAGAIAVNSLGVTLPHFTAALILLGIGWNFLYVGGSTLLASAHSEAERGKVQGLNELLILSLVAVASFLSGALLHQIGWQALNLSLLPLPVLVAIAAMWLRLGRLRPAQVEVV